MFTPDLNTLQNDSTDEELKKKQQQQLFGSSYNPAPGETTENPIQMPNTNTSSGPVSPMDLQNTQTQQMPQPMQNTMQQAPASPVAPVNPAQFNQPQAGQGVQVAGNTQQLPNLPQQPQQPQQIQQPQQMSGQGIQATPQVQQQFQNNVPAAQQQLSNPLAGTVEQQHLTQYEQYQNDPGQLLQLSQSQNAPQWLKDNARERAADILINDRQKKQAEQQLQTMGPTELEKALREKTTGGSWFKAIAYGLLGMQNSAQSEAAKLGIGKETLVNGPNGEAYMIKMAANGTPLSGFNSTTGQKLNPSELISAAANQGQKLDIVGGTYVNDRTGEVGRVVSDKNTGRSYIQTDAGRTSMTGWRPQSSMGTMNDMRARAIQEMNIKLQGKGIEEQMQILRPYNQMLVQQGYTPVQPAEVGIRVPQIGGGNTVSANKPAATAPAPVVVNKPVEPSTVTRPAAITNPPANNARPTGYELEAEKAARVESGKEVGKVAGQNVAGAAGAANTITDIDHSLDILASGKHNIGPMVAGTLSGGGPIGQAVGTQLNTEGARNTKAVMDTVRSIGGVLSQGTIKGHLTNQELQFLTENKPTETSDPEYTKYWLTKARAALERTQRYATEQQTTGGKAENPVLNKHKPGTRENPIKITD